MTDKRTGFGTSPDTMAKALGLDEQDDTRMNTPEDASVTSAGEFGERDGLLAQPDVRERHPSGPHECPHWLTSDPNDTRCDAIQQADEKDAAKVELAAMKRQYGVQATARLDAEARADVAEQALAERDASFDLRWKADMRAIKLWHEAGGDELTWPDHADLVVWLVGQRDAAIAMARELAKALSRHHSRVGVTLNRIGPAFGKRRCACGEVECPQNDLLRRFDAEYPGEATK